MGRCKPRATMSLTDRCSVRTPSQHVRSRGERAPTAGALPMHLHHRGELRQFGVRAVDRNKPSAVLHRSVALEATPKPEELRMRLRGIAQGRFSPPVPTALA